MSEIISQLLTHERDAAHPSLFEEAIAAAFGYLGFAATHIGGSGDTDVFLAAHYTPEPYSVVVDAKTTSHSRISDGQIQWYHIEQHRTGRKATFAAIIACGFQGGLLAQQAAENDVALVTTDQLRQVLQWHAATPLSLQQLRPLFESDDAASPGIAQIESMHNARIRSRLVLAAVIASMAQYHEAGYSAVSPQPLNGYLFARAAEFELTPPPTVAEVTASVELLANPIVGVLQSAGENSYALTMAPKTAAELFRQVVHLADRDAEDASLELGEVIPTFIPISPGR